MARGQSPSGNEAQGGMRRQQRRTLLIVGVVIVLGIAGAIWLTVINSRPAETGEDRIALDPTIGPADAPVTIVEYGDFGCPSCRVWHQAGIRKKIIDAYGDQVRFVFKDFPVITPQSPQAAEAGQCALDQDLFWEFHDVVYEQYQGLFEPDLAFYAERAGLDMAAFQECLDSGQHRDTVRADLQEGAELGLPGTPSFLINGERLNGVPSYDTFSAQIDSVLAG